MWDSKFRCIMQSNHGNFFWMSIVAQVVLLFTKTFIWRDKITLDVAKCLGWLLMHKLCLVATRDLCGCSKWPSLCIDAKVVPLYTNRFVWMHKLTLDVAGCLWCLLMNLLCLHEPRELCICSKCPLMQLDVLDGYRCSRWPLTQLDV